MIIIRWIIEIIVYRFLFNQINRINFRIIFRNFTTQLLTMSTVNIWVLLRDLFLDRIINNNFFRILEATYGLNIRLLFDQRSKRAFWFGFIFTLILYKWYILFKKLLLWPFKLGICSFIFSIFGIDMSWLLGWFNVFSFNVPQWVYIQYLTLYNNWLSWWNNNVNIKSLNNISLPSNKNINLDIYSEQDPPTETDNKVLNKKKIIIGLTIIALIGVGIWYFYYSGSGANGGPDNGGAGNGGNNLIPQNPPQNPQIIAIRDRQTGNIVDPNLLTDAERLSLLDRAYQLRDAARITRTQHDQIINDLLPPAPSYESSSTIETSTTVNTNPPVTESNVTVSQSTNTRLSRELDRYFPINGDNATASGSGSGAINQSYELSQAELDRVRQARVENLGQDRIENTLSQERLNTPSSSNNNSSSSPNISSSITPIDTSTESTNIPSIEVIPATPVDYDPIETFNQPVRPHSPAGSDDSSETIRPFLYGDPGERPRIALPRRPFD